MAESLVTKLKLSIQATLTNPADLVAGSAPLVYSKDLSWVSGTGVDQADRIFSDTRTIAASGTDDLDLAGVLVDALGQTVSFVKVTAILIVAAAANTNDVIVGGAASAQFATPFGAATHTVKVKPGGWMMLVARDATAYGVTATTADLLRVANSGAGTSVDYDVVIIGRSA